MDRRDPKEIVRAGYNRVAEAYRVTCPGDGSNGGPDMRVWVDAALAEIGTNRDDNLRIVELGCGDGYPIAGHLPDSCRYTGYDISPAQITRAAEQIPGRQFFCADMTEVALPEGSVDLVIAFYAIIHLPLDEQSALFRRIAAWLRPGGLFLATLGTSAWTGSEEDWLDVPDATMYWSHTDETTYRAWIEEAGLIVVATSFVPEGSGGHTLFRALKPTSATR